MKKTIIPCSLALLSALPASAGIIYFDVNNLVIPNDFDGVYVNIVTGATSNDVDLVTFNSGPWINLYQGGTAIAASEMLHPWNNQSSGYNGSTAGNFFVNVKPGSSIGTTGVVDPIDGALTGSFTTGESASEFHIGSSTYQFVSGETGYLAFAYEHSSIGSGTAYGWFSFTPTVGGSGVGLAFARSDTPGESLLAAAVPEPSTYSVLVGGMVLGLAVLKRRRS